MRMEEVEECQEESAPSFGTKLNFIIKPAQISKQSDAGKQKERRCGPGRGDQSESS